MQSCSWTCEICHPLVIWPLVCELCLSSVSIQSSLQLMDWFGIVLSMHRWMTVLNANSSIKQFISFQTHHKKTMIDNIEKSFKLIMLQLAWRYVSSDLINTSLIKFILCMNSYKKQMHTHTTLFLEVHALPG